MLIDWFTVSAQAVNFLILVYLLKRFLYGPILKAMDRREEKIAERLRQAVEKQSAAEKETQAYQRKARELEEERPRRLKAIEEEAETQRRERLDQARAEVEETRRAWRASVVREQQNFLVDLKQRAGSEVVRIARKSLAELADGDLQAGLVKKFLERLRGLSGEEKKKWAGAAAEEEVVVTASFDPDPELRDEIAEALQVVCGREPRLVFRNRPEMALEVEMTAAGVRLSWGLKSYFESLEKKVADLLKEQAEAFGSPDEGEPLEPGKPEGR